MLLESIKNPYVKYLAKLHNKKYRDLEKKFLVEGKHLVLEANKTNNLEAILTSDQEFNLDGVKKYLVNDAIIKKLSFTKTPQNIIGLCKYFENKKTRATRFLILDEIQDPGNLGVLVRSSLGFNIDRVYLSKNSVDKYNDKFIRASQGAVFYLDIEEVEIKEVIEELKSAGVFIVGTSLKAAVELTNLQIPKKYAIILGNEGRGVSEEILSLTDQNIYIETNPHLESLNIAVAGGIILHHFNQKNPEN